MRKMALLFAALASTSGALTVDRTSYSVTANPQQGFKLRAWFNLAAEFPKDERNVLLEFKCNLGKQGAVSFLKPDPRYQWGDEVDQQSILKKYVSGGQFRDGTLSASCLDQKLVVNAGTGVALRKAFPDEKESLELLQFRQSLDMRRDMIFNPSGMTLFDVPIHLQGNLFSAPDTAPGVAIGVNQGGAVQSVAIGAKSTPVKINPAKPYTVHVVLGGLWYNLTFSGGQVTAWKSSTAP
ncbi:hypothetical protein Dxin01_04121 [Deinococcus xinjiangensis]|uniref:Uncharacterized protein n=1 Tax=Deinococcus xinjiangensis TaxID=457454 RepID=A0ABP9VI70_9DEIO